MALTSQTKAWKKLAALNKTNKPNLKKWFASDPDRAKSLSISTEHVVYNFSRHLVNKKIILSLIDLANGSKLKDKINTMFSGKKINITENRAVLHIALRNISNKPIMVDGKDVMPEVNAVLSKIESFSQEVLSGKRTGVTGKRFRNILAIGIGGSYLGPEYLAESCKPYAKPGMNLVFIANVDGTDFSRKTVNLDAEETLVIIISKTFTTAETMKNAETVKKWMLGHLGNSPDVIRKHFVAVSTAKEKVEAFGIDPVNMFGFWDWVGGRFSATSAVGAVPLSLYLGYDNFHKILEGANWMDEHFLNEPFEGNIPVMAALLDIWNINFKGYLTRAILPYSQAWHRYAAHCQQVEMESNGKTVTIDGKPVKFDTGEVLFGEPGTNGQHSFYQLIHQGTMVVPCDFIGFINEQYNVPGSPISHHEELMTNFFAQPDALAFGKDDKLPQKVFSGNRPSNVFLFNRQDPFTAGILLALVEHRTAVKGFIWGINSFDQFGVELGKVLGVDMRKRMELYKKDKNDKKIFGGLNSATADTFKKFLQGSLEG
jgi:glucose-6-phosphate isomerase